MATITPRNILIYSYPNWNASARKAPIFEMIERLGIHPGHCFSIPHVIAQPRRNAILPCSRDVREGYRLTLKPPMEIRDVGDRRQKIRGGATGDATNVGAK